MASKNISLRKLGRNGPNVPALGFGLMGLSHDVYGTISNDEERFKILDCAYDLGNTNWDTADLYGDGETLVGKWFERTGKRNEIFLATKFGFVKGSKSYEVDSSGEYCKKACEESLKALGVDSIDLYYMHHANPKTPIEETMRALLDLKAEGKIKYIGLCAISSATLRRAVKVAHVDAVQTDYSPFQREIEDSTGTNLLATCCELGVAVVCAMPLGRGMITTTFASGEPLGDANDKRPQIMPRFMEGNKEKNVEIISDFNVLADKKGCTLAQLALAWLLKQGNDIIPIPGTKQIKYMVENWAAIDIHLSDEDEKEIRMFVERVEIAGPYLPPAFAGYNYTDTQEQI